MVDFFTSPAYLEFIATGLGHGQRAIHQAKEVGMDKFLSTADAAKILGVTPATVRLMARENKLPPAAQTEGGINLFLASDVRSLAATRTARKAANADSVGSRSNG